MISLSKIFGLSSYMIFSAWMILFNLVERKAAKGFLKVTNDDCGVIYLTL